MKRSAAQIGAGLRAARLLARRGTAEVAMPVGQEGPPPRGERALDLELVKGAGNLYEGMDVLTRHPIHRPFVKAAKRILKRLLAPTLVQQSHWNAAVARLLGPAMDGRFATVDEALRERTAAHAALRKDVEALRAELVRLREEMWARQRVHARESEAAARSAEAAERVRE